MTKSFRYFLWVASLVVFLMLASSILSGLVLSQFGFGFGSSFFSWTSKIGVLVSLIVFIPLYKMFKLLSVVNSDTPDSKLVGSIFVLALWFIVPFSYLLAFDKLECREANITHFGLFPARCFQTSPQIFGLSPASGPFETRITIEGEGFMPAGNIVMFGDAGPYRRELDNEPDNVVGYYDSRDGRTIILPVPFTPSGKWCDVSNNCDILLPANPRTPGVYKIYISNKNGVSNTVYFTITP